MSLFIGLDIELLFSSTSGAFSRIYFVLYDVLVIIAIIPISY